MENDQTTVYNSLIDRPIPATRNMKIPSKRLIFMATLVSMGGSFNFGYQLLITNPAQEAFIQFVNQSFVHRNFSQEPLERIHLESVWGGTISLFFWGCTFSSLFIRSAAQRLGRKQALQLSHFIQVAACLFSIYSYYSTDHVSYGMSRFLLGFGVCLSLGITPMFISECSPKQCRGMIGMTTGIALQVALVVGACVAMPQLFGTSHGWWVMYAMEALSTVVVMLLIPFLYDSPSHLLSLGKVDACRKSIAFYHDITEEEVTATVNELEEEMKHSPTPVGLMAIWQDAQNRRGMFLGAVVMLAMVMSGIVAINAFAFEILLSCGLNPLQASLANILVNVMNVIGTCLSSLVIERSGRRKLLLSTYSLLSIINVVIFLFMLSYEYYKTTILGYVLVLCICLFNLVFAAGPGPISFFITPELVSQNARASACAWVQLAMSFSRSVLMVIYLPLKNLIGLPLSYVLLFVPPLIVSVAILYFYLPESKRKTVAEVRDSIHLLPSLRSKKNEEDDIIQ